jgi:catechol 2,3-dioxygenase-like lactoylglutathione lyase family enzyme
MHQDVASDVLAAWPAATVGPIRHPKGREMKPNTAIVIVSDMDISRRFYEQVLGQRVVLDLGANIAFDGSVSLLTRNVWAEFIGKPAEEITLRSHNFELYFERDDFDAFVAHFRTFDIECVHDVIEHAWGQRVIRFYDPDGHVIEVGESMAAVFRRFLAQGLSIEETATRTQHPVEFVRESVQ